MSLLNQLSTEGTNFIELIQRTYEAFRAFWENFGELGLFVYSIFETITPIAGVEVFFVTLITLQGLPWWRIAFVATLANLLGSLIVYFFLAKENNKFYTRLLRKEQRRRAQNLFDNYGVWAIFIFAMTPLPFFIIIFVAALAKMRLSHYMFAVVFARGTRFYITTFILHRFTGTSPLMLVLILFLVAIPMSFVLMFIQKKILAYFENRIQKT